MTEDPRTAALPDIHGHAKGEHKPFAEERPIPYTARMLFLWFFHACRRGSPRFLMVADHMNYLTFEDPAAVNLVRRALKLAQAGDLYGAAETAGVEIGHAQVVGEGLRKGMRYSIGAEIDNDPRCRPDAQNIVDAMKPDGTVRSVHFIPITHPQHGENWMWAFDNPEFKDLYDVVGSDTVWEIYMATLLDAIDKLPGNIVGHFYVPAKFGHWPADDVLEAYEDRFVDACAERGMAIEINSRYIYKYFVDDEANLEKFRAVHLRLMRKAKEKNVAIAVGSDAHSPKDQGGAFEAILALLDEADVNEIAFPIAGRLARVALRATEEILRQHTASLVPPVSTIAEIHVDPADEDDDEASAVAAPEPAPVVAAPKRKRPAPKAAVAVAEHADRADRTETPHAETTSDGVGQPETIVVAEEAAEPVATVAPAPKKARPKKIAPPVESADSFPEQLPVAVAADAAEPTEPAEERPALVQVAEAVVHTVTEAVAAIVEKVVKKKPAAEPKAAASAKAPEANLPPAAKVAPEKKDEPKAVVAKPAPAKPAPKAASAKAPAAKAAPAKVTPPKAAPVKAAPAKSAPPKAAVAKAAPKKAASKKPAARPAVAKKSAPVKKTAPVKKVAAKKPAAKKVVAKKAASKKPVAKKAVAKKPVAKKVAPKRASAPVRKPAAKKAVKKAAKRRR